MNIQFNGKTYEELFHELFDDIINLSQLNIKKVNENTMNIVGDNFILTIYIFVEGTSVDYTNLITKERYDISDYLLVRTNQQDREGLSPQKIISEVIKRSLTIRSRVLAREFKNLLEGKIDWFENYRSSEYFWKKDFKKEIL